MQGMKSIHVGRNVWIDSFFRLDCYPTPSSKPSLSIGDNTMIGFRFTALCTTKLGIGKEVLIASGVLISTTNHGTNPELGNYCLQPLTS
jgi:acetyltransferase-like isoleucine patch superfamily enzyme